MFMTHNQVVAGSSPAEKTDKTFEKMMDFIGKQINSYYERKQSH